MKVVKAIKLIKRSHKLKRAQDLFKLKYPPLIVSPDQYKYLKDLDEKALKLRK